MDSDPITVLGAHCDSINNENPFFPAPGADDDASGTVTILEAYRGWFLFTNLLHQDLTHLTALLRAEYIPTSPLEFHFYSAEEVRLAYDLHLGCTNPL